MTNPAIPTRLLHSVILANYNGEDFLADAIRSVLAQEEVAFELLLVDDGSIDASLDVMRSFSLQYPDVVRVLTHDRNRGQGAGFNTGIAAARGELVSFIDSDDIWYPGKLRHVEASFAHRPDIILHHHNLNLIRNGQVSPQKFVDMMALGDIGVRWRQTRSLPEFLPRFAPTSGLTLPRSVLEKIQPCPEIRVCADMWLTFTPLAFGPVSASFDAFGAYRVHDGNNFYGRKVDVWALLQDQLGPPMRTVWARHNVPDVLPPPPALKDRLLNLSLRKVLRRMRTLIAADR
jgi:glycosyltransferase involved in cell wall biosynthesis